MYGVYGRKRLLLHVVRRATMYAYYMVHGSKCFGMPAQDSILITRGSSSLAEKLMTLRHAHRRTNDRRPVGSSVGRFHTEVVVFVRAAALLLIVGSRANGPLGGRGGKFRGREMLDRNGRCGCSNGASSFRYSKQLLQTCPARAIM